MSRGWARNHPLELPQDSFTISPGSRSASAPSPKGGLPAHAHLTAWTGLCITMHSTEPNALHWAHRDVATMRSPLQCIASWQCISPMQCMGAHHLSNALARPMPMHISYTLHGVSCITMQCMPHHIATSRHRDALSNALPHAMHPSYTLHGNLPCNAVTHHTARRRDVAMRSPMHCSMQCLPPIHCMV